MNGNILYEIQFGGSDVIEIIVKYNGNIDRIANEVGASVEVLSNSFAILKISVNEIQNLSEYNEIIYIELPKILRLFLDTEKADSCITYGGENIGELLGDGVIVGIIDSGIEENLPFSNKIKYKKLLSENADTTHGTMVATIINNIAPNADIVFVAIGRNDFFASDTDIMRGIKFIADSAEGSPFAINISYGTNSGSHNGNTLFEEYINEICQNYRCSIVIATGNEGDKGRHYSNILSTNESNVIEFNVDGGLPYTVMEVWKNFTDKFSYEVIAPNGDRSGSISPEVEQTSFILGNNKIYFIFTEPSPYNILEQVYIRIEGITNVSTGVWRLVVNSIDTVVGEYNIWSTQVRFLSPDIYTTLTVPSTASRVISVGAYNSQTNSQTGFSGRGYTANGMIKPDIVAPGVNVIVRGTPNTGTSVSAPFVTGSCVLLMEWGIVKGNDRNMYGERLKAYLRLGAQRESGLYPNRVYGYGKLCLSNTFNNLISVRTEEINISPAYSNDYIELIIRYSIDTIDILNENNISYCIVESGDLIVAYLNENDFRLLSNMTQFLTENDTELFGLMSEELNVAAGISRVQRPPLDLRGRDVVVGFIDTGINYDNPEFLYENGDNRIHCIWDMTVENEKSENVCFGRVYTNEELTNRTATTRDNLGHGTAMAIQACGNTGAAPESIIIAVKLKQAKDYMYEEQFVDRNVPAYSTSDIILGIDFIISEAKRINKPLVLVLGIGTNEGGHDGSSVFERYLSRLGEISGTIVVVPTGNEAIARHHTNVMLDNDNSYYDIEINVAENVRGFNMWIWNTILDKVEVSIISPLGETINRITAVNNFSNEYTLFQTNTRVKVTYSLPVFQTVDQRTTLRFTTPLAGVWKVRVYGSTLYGGINAWLPISQFIGGDVVFTSSDSNLTVTVPATADNVMVVGGFSPSDNSVLAQSGRGPTRRGELRPYFVSPTNNNSTSIAASVAAGAAALLLQWGIINGNMYSINSITATALIINGAVQSPGEIYPNNILGFGRLDLYNVFFKI